MWIGWPVGFFYKKFLELKPAAEKSDLVRQLIGTAEKEFIRHLKGSSYMEEEDRVELLETVPDVNHTKMYPTSDERLIEVYNKHDELIFIKVFSNHKFFNLWETGSYYAG